MIKTILFILLTAVNAHAGKVVMEGISATNDTIFVDTTNARIGISTNTPNYRLDVYGDIRATGTIYGAFSPNATVPPAYIDLSTVTTALAGKLTGPATFYVVKDTDYLQNPATNYWVKSTDYLINPASFTYQAPGLTVLKAGDTMTGSLVGTNAYMSANITADTMTVTGPSFSVGGSTLVVANGALGIGTSTPTAGIQFGVGNTLSLNTIDGYDNQFACIAGGGALSNVRGSYLCVYGNERVNNAGRIVVRAGNVIANNTTDGTIGFQIGNSVQELTLNATGYLGLGTTSPLSKLHVVGDATISTSLTASSGTFNGVLVKAAASDAIIQMQEGATATAQLESYLGDLYFNTQAVKDIIFRPNSTEKMRISGEGHVNIVNGVTASSFTATGGLWVGANAYFVADVSALTFTDRTPYPETLAIAYAEIDSIKRSPNNPKQVDHDVLHANLKRPFKHSVVDHYETVTATYTEKVDGEDVIKTREEQKPVYVEVLEQGRDLSETVSALVEVIKDLNKRIKELEKK